MNIARSSASTFDRPIRVLYSFPHKLGADRICYTAWQQVNGLAAAGAQVLVFPGAVSKAVMDNVQVKPTLARGRVHLPYKVLGSKRAFALHDCIVSKRLERLAPQIDIVHTWPLGARETLKTAAKLGIPSVLERPNANTRFAMEVVQEECRRIGVALPPNHEHAYNADTLSWEEEEYAAANRLLCPSDFVVRTFLDKGYPPDKLIRHIYGYDETVYYPPAVPREPNRGLTMLFVGVCAVRKGVHYALDAWLRSPASVNGTFLIAGEFLPAYESRLSSMLSHPSVRVLGHRTDVPDLMRNSDILVLPSIEEGFGLVVAEAIGSGCVPLISDACTDVCQHMQNGLIHRVGDVTTLANQITMLHNDRLLLEGLRREALRTAHNITWRAAGVTLLDVYRQTMSAFARSGAKMPTSSAAKAKHI